MATKTTFKTFEIHTITCPNGKTRLSIIPEKGGIASSLIIPFQKTERELLFQHDHFWERGNPHLPGGSPLLFPICGRLERNLIAGNYLYDGQVYNMPIHGFSAHLPWQVQQESNLEDQITLFLTDTEETRKIYPFNFRVELTYQVSDRKMLCLQRYINTGDRSMPYYTGFHPYFATPEPGAGKEQVMLTCNPARHFQYNERLSDVIGEQPPFKTPISATSPKIHEQLILLTEDSELSLSYPDGLRINLHADGIETERLFPYLQIYSPSDQPFICIEPYMSFPNAMNTMNGPRWLKPGQSEDGIFIISV